ncbi:hypothetical protein WA026_011446 [Henosepilachna vigintioctopunctata]|uniref:Uncharacterized protein n=1 Tax=Henosepilachna vigintioctopunctata TaxID=420089 RepID=A0AAW1TS43_9CUCU
MLVSRIGINRLAAAQEAAAQQAVAQQAGVGAADKMGGASAAGGQGPSSLFLLTDQNIIRRYTRFIIEWPYPFKTIFIELNHVFTISQQVLTIYKLNYNTFI